MPGVFSFLMPTVMFVEELEEDGKLASPSLQYTPFSVLLEQEADTVSTDLLEDSERIALKAVIKELLEIYPVIDQTLKQITLKYPQIFYKPMPLEALISVILYARNQSIEIARKCHIDKTEKDQIQFLTDTQISLHLMYCIKNMMNTHLYQDSLQSEGLWLIKAISIATQNTLHNISHGFHTEYYVEHYDLLKPYFVLTSSLGISTYLELSEKFNQSDLNLDRKHQRILFIYSLDWNLCQAQYYFALGDNEKALNHLALLEPNANLETILKSLDPQHAQLYHFHNEQHRVTQNESDSIDPIYTAIYHSQTKRIREKASRLKTEILSDKKRSAYAQLYAYIKSDPKDSTDAFMRLFLKQTPLEFQMCGKIELVNLSTASEITNTTLPLIKQRFRFLMAAKARGYDQSLELIVQCKIIILHLNGILGNDKTNILASKLKAFLLEYENNIDMHCVKIQGSQAKRGLPVQSSCETKKSLDKPVAHKPEKKKTKPAVKATPKPAPKPAPEPARCEPEPEPDKTKCLESELTAEIVALEKTNADLNSAILANQNLTKEKQTNINSQITQLKQQIQNITPLQTTLKEACLKAENLQKEALQKKAEQKAALQNKIEQLKKENSLLKLTYQTPQAIEQEQQRIEQTHQQQIDALKKQQTTYLAAQQQQTTVLLQLETHLKEARIQAEQKRQVNAQTDLKKESVHKLEALRQQLEEVRLENLRLHTASQHFQYTLDTLNTEKRKFEYQKSLKDADLERDLKGYLNIANLVRTHLQPTPPPVFTTQPYALSAPPLPPLHPVAQAPVMQSNPVPNPNPVERHGKQRASGRTAKPPNSL